MHNDADYSCTNWPHDAVPQYHARGSDRDDVKLHSTHPTPLSPLEAARTASPCCSRTVVEEHVSLDAGVKQHVVLSCRVRVVDDPAGQRARRHRAAKRPARRQRVPHVRLQQKVAETLLGATLGKPVLGQACEVEQRLVLCPNTHTYTHPSAAATSKTQAVWHALSSLANEKNLQQGSRLRYNHAGT